MGSVGVPGLRLRRIFRADGSAHGAQVTAGGELERLVAIGTATFFSQPGFGSWERSKFPFDVAADARELRLWWRFARRQIGHGTKEILGV